MAKPIKHGNKWRIRWKDSRGIRRSGVYASYKDADYALKKFQTEAEEISKVLRLPISVDKTFNDLVTDFLKQHSSQKRNPEDDESIIRVHLRPFFGNMKLVDLSANSCAEFILSKKHLSPKTVHNILTLLISMLNFSYDSGWLIKVPKIRKPKIHLLSGEFSYLKTD